MRELLNSRTMSEESHEFSPDWCIAPAAALQEWLDEHNLQAATFYPAAVSPDSRDIATSLVADVLARRPLTSLHARILRYGTGISESMWLGLEHNYRAGLAAGLKDAT